MDGDDANRTRDSAHRRRWSTSSMSSQRLDVIVTRLMKPLKQSDLNQNFGTEFASLLEDYLTEVGLRHLEDEEEDEFLFPVNFIEAGLILQQTVLNYGMRVDHVYEAVLEMGARMASGSGTDGESPAEVTPLRSRRKQNNSDNLVAFNAIDLEIANNIILKDTESIKQPLRLPKSYIEFEPRVVSDGDLRLFDYNNEMIGLLNDFHVNWNMDENGMLVDDLDASSKINRELLIPLDVRTMNLVPESMITPPDSLPSFDSDHFKEPLPILHEVAVIVKNVRKRRLNGEHLSKAHLNEKITESLLSLLKASSYLDEESTGITDKSVACTVQKKTSSLMKLRKLLEHADLVSDIMTCMFAVDCVPMKMRRIGLHRFQRIHLTHALKVLSVDLGLDFHGFEGDIHCRDFGQGCRGFIEEEINEAHELAKNVCRNHERLLRLSLAEPTVVVTNPDHDDSGWFDDSQPSTSMEEPSSQCLTDLSGAPADQSEITKRVEAWHGLIRPRLEKAENRSEFNVHDYGKTLMDTFQNSEEIEFSDVVNHVPQEEVSRYLLAVLMLANTGNVSIIKNDPGQVGNFKIRLLSKNDALYRGCNPLE